MGVSATCKKRQTTTPMTRGICKSLNPIWHGGNTYCCQLPQDCLSTAKIIYKIVTEKVSKNFFSKASPKLGIFTKIVKEKMIFTDKKRKQMFYERARKTKNSLPSKFITQHCSLVDANNYITSHQRIQRNLFGYVA